jgi:glycine/D-amino acid oxidase-like deaminating enzyme
MDRARPPATRLRPPTTRATTRWSTPTPAAARDYAPTYWVASAGTPPPDDGPLAGDIDADVVIVGSGFTGLAAALFLAREHGIRATVLEANQQPPGAAPAATAARARTPAAGCTARSGSRAGARTPRSRWTPRSAAASRPSSSLVAEFPECEPQPAATCTSPTAQEAGLPAQRGRADARGVRLRHAHAVGRRGAREYVRDAECHGALLEPDGIGVHPLKLAFGYLRRARAPASRCTPASPVTGIETRGGVHHLRTPGGTVRARAVGFCTGGYTSNGLHPSLDNKIMPILSNSLVTRLTQRDERAATGLHSTTRSSPTRARCASTTGCCPTAACRSAAAAPSPAPTRPARATCRCWWTACTASFRRSGWKSTTRGGAGSTSATT